MTLQAAWHVLYWLWIASEILVVLLTYTRRGQGATADRGSMILLWVVIWCAISAGTWYAALHPPTIFSGAPWVGTLSLAILVLGLGLRWTAILQLGRAFSVNVAIHAGQRVMRSGLYRWMRHPSYTGLLLAILALGVHTRNWIGLALILVPITAALLYRIRVEETALSAAFGDEYLEYSAATRRLVPGVY